MYLSTLLIDVGDNPDHARPGRIWLHNVYRVHQRLCMAFPSAQKQRDDNEWLKPYNPDDFAAQVHAPRNVESGFLFRIDPQPGNQVVILVLSAALPDWNYAFGLKPGMVDPHTNKPIGNAGHLLAAPPSQPRLHEITVEIGNRFHFRLLANPTKKVHKLLPDSSRQEPLTGNGRRVPEEPAAWLQKQAARRGFKLVGEPFIQTGYVYFSKTSETGGGHRLWSARYEGILEITDSAAFAKTLASGVGPAKGFGFGLLSVAPL